MSIGKLCKKELNFINLWDKLTETKEVEGLSGIEYVLANNEAKQDLMCSECGLHKKEYSNYCKPCWDSKMQN